MATTPAAGTTEERLARAHAFISTVAEILTEDPEFAALQIEKLFEEQGPQLTADGANITG